MRAGIRTRMKEGTREGMQPNQNKVTYIIEFDW